jgi:hypothetical protein
MEFLNLKDFTLPPTNGKWIECLTNFSSNRKCYISVDNNFNEKLLNNSSTKYCYNSLGPNYIILDTQKNAGQEKILTVSISSFENDKLHSLIGPAFVFISFEKQNSSCKLFYINGVYILPQSFAKEVIKYLLDIDDTAANFVLDMFNNSKNKL